MKQPASHFLAALLGHPVAHSLSPAIFQILNSLLGGKARSDKKISEVAYTLIDLPPEKLASRWESLRDLGIFAGFNVTLPFKNGIIAFLDELSAEAKLISSVNVIRVDPATGRTYGHNTDVHGIRETLQEQKFRVKGKTALILGAGGSAFSVGYVLGQAGARHVDILNRTMEHAQNLAERLSQYFPATTFKARPLMLHQNPATTLFINTTPLGMAGFPNSNFAPFFPAKPLKNSLAFDLIYGPKLTPFLAQAKSLKIAQTVGGLDMLIWQALGTWEIWFERKLGKFQQRKLKNLIKKALVKKAGA